MLTTQLGLCHMSLERALTTDLGVIPTGDKAMFRMGKGVRTRLLGIFLPEGD